MKVDPGNGVNFLIMRTFHVLIVVFLLGACARRQPVPETVRPVKVTTAAGAAVIDKDFAGLATPDDAVNLAFKLPGQVLDVPVAQGESVKKGALLAELDPRDIELQVSADRSAFEEARSQMQRMQRLLEHEAVSRQEFESAQTRYAQVKSAYENSLGLLKETKLRAPFASVVERKFVDNYERVQAGQSIVRVVNPVTTKVQFTMPESGLSLLSLPSTRFEVEFDNYRGVRFPAVLKDYAKTSSDASGFPVSLRLTDVDTGRFVLLGSCSERRSRYGCGIPARLGRLCPGRRRHLRLGGDRRRPCRAPGRNPGRIVRPRPGRDRQRGGTG